MSDISDECCSDVVTQRHSRLASSLSVYEDRARLPVDIVKIEVGNFAGAQTELGEDHQNAMVLRRLNGPGLSLTSHLSSAKKNMRKHGSSSPGPLIWFVGSDRMETHRHPSLRIVISMLDCAAYKFAEGT